MKTIKGYCKVCNKPLYREGQQFCSVKCTVKYNRDNLWSNEIIKGIRKDNFVPKEIILSKIQNLDVSKRSWSWHDISLLLKNAEDISPLYLSTAGGDKLIGYADIDEAKRIEGVNIRKRGIMVGAKAMEKINELTQGDFNKYKPFTYSKSTKLKVKPKKIKKEVIDGLYQEIMNLFWNNGKKKEITAKEVYNTIGGDRVKCSTYLGRLYIKGLLDRRTVIDKGGVKFIYWTRVSRGEYFKNLLKKWIGNDVDIGKLFR